MGESSRDAGRASVGAPGVSVADTCTETRRSASEKLPNSVEDKFSSVDPDSKSSHKADNHGCKVVSVLAAMEGPIRSLNNDNVQTLYQHPWVV